MLPPDGDAGGGSLFGREGIRWGGIGCRVLDASQSIILVKDGF